VWRDATKSTRSGPRRGHDGPARECAAQQAVAADDRLYLAAARGSLCAARPWASPTATRGRATLDHLAGAAVASERQDVRRTDRRWASTCPPGSTTGRAGSGGKCYLLVVRQAKQTVRELLDKLPDDCSLDDVLYHLYVIQAIDRGLADSEAGRLIPHDVVVREMRRKWQVGREP